jgi:hypothetical protein
MNSAVEIGSKWIRHRGGKMPVKKGVAIEVKHRDGDVYEDEAGGTFSRDWSHTGGGGDIMQYRIIKQLKVEEVEYRGPFPSAPIGDYANVIEYDIEFPSGVCSVEAKTDQIDGPIKWRDIIIHCQAIIEDCEREIERNVDLLDAEGLMMQTDSKKAVQYYATDMSNSKNWKVGDIVECVTTEHQNFISVGTQYEIEKLRDGEIEFIDDDGDEMNYTTEHFKFVRRP